MVCIKLHMDSKAGAANPAQDTARLLCRRFLQPLMMMCCTCNLAPLISHPHTQKGVQSMPLLASANIASSPCNCLGHSNFPAISLTSEEHKRGSTARHARKHSDESSNETASNQHSIQHANTKNPSQNSVQKINTTQPADVSIMISGATVGWVITRDRSIICTALYGTSDGIWDELAGMICKQVQFVSPCRSQPSIDITCICRATSSRLLVVHKWCMQHAQHFNRPTFTAILPKIP